MKPFIFNPITLSCHSKSLLGFMSSILDDISSQQNTTLPVRGADGFCDQLVELNTKLKRLGADTIPTSSQLGCTCYL